MTPDWISFWQAWLPASSGSANGATADDPLGSSFRAFEAFATAFSQNSAAEPTAQMADIVVATLQKLIAAAKAGAEPPGGVHNAWRDLTKLAGGPGGFAPRDYWPQLLEQWSNEWLSLPAMGPYREWQGSLQRIAKASVSQAAAWQRLEPHYQQVLQDALRQFKSYLNDDGGTPIESLAALYDAWIDHCESAYHTVVMEPAYARDFAAWVNACSQTKLACKDLNARMAKGQSGPWDEQLQRDQQQIQELCAELRELKDRLAALEKAPGARRTVADKPPSKPATAQARRGDKPKSATRVASKAPRARRKKRPVSEFDIGDILDPSS